MEKSITSIQIHNPQELGELVRTYRKQRHLTLETVAGLSNLSIRFLSEFERGKQTAEIGKVFKALQILGLEVIVQPRGENAGSGKQYD